MAQPQHRQRWPRAGLGGNEWDCWGHATEEGAGKLGPGAAAELARARSVPSRLCSGEGTKREREVAFRGGREALVPPGCLRAGR